MREFGLWIAVIVALAGFVISVSERKPTLAALNLALALFWIWLDCRREEKP